MVYFSNREKIILQLLTQKSEGVMLEEIIQTLELSKRTIYRELASLEATLANENIGLLKENKFYKLQVNEQQLASLKNQIGQNIVLEWSDLSKRKAAILERIALSPDSTISLKSLSEDFQLSLTTISDSIQKINQDITKYNFKIIPSKNGILEIDGNESYIRLYLSQVLTQEINEFDFYQSMNMEGNLSQFESESQYLLCYLDTDLLSSIYQSIHLNQSHISENLSDLNLMNFVIQIAVSILRLRQGKQLSYSEISDANKLLPYVNRIFSIVKALNPEDKALLTTTDISFIAMHLRGMNLNASHSIFQHTYDMELGYSVKNLIRLISKEYHYDFNLDSQLYHDLINHIGSALKRIDLNLPEMENTVIIQLKEKYHVLYEIIEEKLIEVFSPTIFSEQEIGYIVVHFASSLEKYGKMNNLKILVICTSGLGTSKILKAQLEKAIPEINRIDVMRTLDFMDTNMEEYALILSTIPLKGFQHPYYLINAILNQDEIKMVQSVIKDQANNYQELSQGLKPNAADLMPYDTLAHYIEVTQAILQNFDIIDVDHPYQNIDEFIQDTFGQAQPVTGQLIHRMNEAPLVIPDTGLMLLHTIDEQITTPLIKFYHLKNPLKALDMSNQKGQVNRIIVMLGSQNMGDMTTDFLGNFSASLIENQSYTSTYQKGDANSILILLKKIMMTTLYQML